MKAVASWMPAIDIRSQDFTKGFEIAWHVARNPVIHHDLDVYDAKGSRIDGSWDMDGDVVKFTYAGPPPETYTISFDFRD